MLPNVNDICLEYETKLLHSKVPLTLHAKSSPTPHGSCDKRAL